jgi:DNA-binding transcriptional MerR regulator
VDSNEYNPGLYPIRTVSELTGVNSITLRAWERRYGIVNPVRAANGHRAYSLEDVEQIRAIVALLEQGVPISRVKSVLRQSPLADTADTGHQADAWRAYGQRMMDAIATFDEARLERIYNEAMSLYPVDIVTRLLLIPLLEQLGERWQQIENGIAEEHFFAVYLRNKLGARFHHREQRSDGEKILAACLPGEHHELGLLLFALAAHDRGFRLVLLGANTPVSELAGVAPTIGADAIALSGSVVANPSVISQDLSNLIDHLSIPVFVGGQVCKQYGSQLQQAGAITVGQDLMQGLKRIHSHFRPGTTGR